jgi:hypothetical protein
MELIPGTRARADMREDYLHRESAPKRAEFRRRFTSKRAQCPFLEYRPSILHIFIFRVLAPIASESHKQLILIALFKKQGNKKNGPCPALTQRQLSLLFLRRGIAPVANFTALI